ncbi:MAG: PDZ domain-containing protein [Caulobacteraceae bacterium]|nr:PDZ domain-containing protein [Caulobacter sp.]
MRKLILVGVSTFALGAAAMACAQQGASASAATSSADTYKMLELFGDVLTTVKKQYVAPTDDKKLIQAAIDGMLTSLDPHSGYLDPTEFTSMRDETRGDYGGLGLVVQADENAIKIVSPIDDTPAAKAGIRAGDYITAIDGKSILGQPLNDAVKSMRGAVGQPVTLTLVRDRKEPFTLTLKRQVIDIHTVSHHTEGDIGYLRVSQFDEKTGDETAAALRDLKAKLPHMKGLVLDLRNNPGGLVDTAVDVANDFLDGGEIVSQRGRDPRDIQRYNARPNGDMIKGVPMVVLINYGSASAAEIVSGALKDRDRATIVGLTSFGKGSVQTVIPLRGGADGALKLTTARYYTPSGVSIQKTGITPDLVVARNREEAQLVTDEAKFDFTEASYRNALDAQEGRVRKISADIQVPPAALDHSLDKTGDDKKDKLIGPDSVILPGEKDDPSKDYQLQRALDVLHYGSVQAAEAAKPSAVFAPPKAQFAMNDAATTRPAAQRVRDGAPEASADRVLVPRTGPDRLAPGAAPAKATPGTPASKITPPGQVAPSQPAPAIPR